MKISDNEIREKLLAHLKLKGELSTKSLLVFGNTWAGDSKLRSILLSLEEEGILKSKKYYYNKTSQVFWQLESNIPPVKEVAMTHIDPDVTAQLKHEFEIILRKQQRRRDWAGKVLQNAEAVIKQLEDKIRCL